MLNNNNTQYYVESRNGSKFGPFPTRILAEAEQARLNLQGGDLFEVTIKTADGKDVLFG